MLAVREVAGLRQQPPADPQPQRLPLEPGDRPQFFGSSERLVLGADAAGHGGVDRAGGGGTLCIIPAGPPAQVSGVQPPEAGLRENASKFLVDLEGGRSYLVIIGRSETAKRPIALDLISTPWPLTRPSTASAP